MFPIRAAFYYPWYPEAWRQKGLDPYTKAHPTLGFYDSTSTALIRKHVAALRYARMNAAISSWWGVNHRTDVRFGRLLSVTASMRSPLRWAVYYESEGKTDPSVDQIRSDLAYLKRRYASHPNYLRVAGKFVVFVYGGAESCATAARWADANTVGAYVVLKVFSGYRACDRQPEGWHQYAPAVATDEQPPSSFSVSPGFDKADEAAPRLARDLARWRADVKKMVASQARFQLVTTFNEWGEGTAVEPAREWQSRSGYGAYLDALRTALAPPAAKPKPKPKPAPKPKPGAYPVIVAAGDIASCASGGDEATAALVDRIAGTVATLGDTVYDSGTPDEFARCYTPSWGRFKARTKPATGNHDYLTAGAAGYFDYFGAAAGDRSRGYYSYDRGAWHVVVLNSNCSRAGGCGVRSPQERWLRDDLARHRTTCTLAYWHHPLFSSGEHGNQPQVAPLWQALYDANADVVLSGHDHDYERFQPQTATGATDLQRGIAEFVVGTGGKNHYRFSRTPEPNSMVRNDDTFGVLKLTLRPAGYDWRFVPEAGRSFTDSGSASCH